MNVAEEIHEIKSIGEDLNYSNNNNRCAIQNYQTTNPKKPARHVLGFAMKAEKGLISAINKKTT